MAETVTQTNIATDSWYQLIQRINELAGIASNTAVTANNTGGTDTVTGTGFVTGLLGANNLVASTALRGGTVSTPATLPITSNVLIGTDLFVTGIANLITNTASQIIDSYPIATYRGAKYLLQITGVSINAYYSGEILVLHDGTNPYTTEYAQLFSNGSLGAVSANIANSMGGSTGTLFLNLLFSPVALATATNINFARHTLTL